MNGAAAQRSYGGSPIAASITRMEQLFITTAPLHCGATLGIACALLGSGLAMVGIALRCMRPL